MNEENMKKFHPELAKYYQKGDCCIWIVELRKRVSEKDKEIERLNNIINELEKYLKNNFWNDDEGNESYQIEKYTTYYSVYNKLKELKESDENE